MDSIIAFALSLGPVKKAWDAFDGYKTYVGAAVVIVGALGKMLVAGSAIGAAFVACKDLACAVGVARNLSSSPDAASFAAAWTALGTGLGILGLRHAVAKGQAAPDEAADEPVSPVEAADKEDGAAG